ncbi:hypothetical protein WA1_38320 [Scytonema hofmannii PCC 7110]|uniref:Leucine-binding protein domain-containing protein n=1 Tax=Scytonema hofmannii PCC 7110 TaxID=128403 RepID=A0A139X0Q4_9CYAN|nr:ABC transporter substrate-binding protein [Scytonema hofmannii]KYC38202.1 hypothetical protein WA1_38320 [Scytonema hofmannii PCC 7110]
MNNSTSRRNPYIIGRPSHEPEKFFGRESLFQFIEHNLSRGKKVILLHGQRRIGVSSVLHQIPHKVAQDKFAFVLFDLQGYSHSSLSDILYNLAEAIVEDLDLSSEMIAIPSNEELYKDPNIFSNNFLAQVFQELGERNLVLLLDEFDVVSSDSEILHQGDSFLRYLQSFLNKQKKLFIIPVVGRFKDDLQDLLDLFKNAPYQKVDLLDELSARRLITKPAQDILEYEEDAIKAILQLSAGHPYLIQAICFNLFIQATIEEKSTVTPSDVQDIVDKAIESATGGLTWFWDGLSISEKVVFSAIAEAQQIAIEQNQPFPEDPFALLRRSGVIPTDDLLKAAQKLTLNDFLDDTHRRVKIELVRRWLVRYHPLQETIWKLEEIGKEEINKLEGEAIQLHKTGNLQETIDCYVKILNLNPNHFSTLLVLAERYLDVRNFEKALELYQRAYQIDSTHNKERLLLARETYGNNLINQREFIKAKIQFEKVLEIEPDRVSAKYKLRDIEAEISQQQLDRDLDISEQYLPILSEQTPKTRIRQPSIILSIIAAVIALVGGIGIYQISTSCSGGQQKVNGSCVSIPLITATPIPTPTQTSIPGNIESKISRGERTLFFSITNAERDQGLEAFQKGNYSQAVELFQKAIVRDRKDPEVRIYYNNAQARDNAQARKKSNPLTLAVVVPADNAKSISQQILRGVAQAQEQFNTEGGLNGRLLEIVIANDGNNPDQAKQIAQQLVNDQSVLGIIGHNSSRMTQAALPVYKREGIPIVSSTSTANTLDGNVFFRTAPPDETSAKTLAEYAQRVALKKVVIFYNPNDPYSNSFREEFSKNFKDKERIFRKVDLTDEKLNIEQELKDSVSQQVQAVMLFSDVDHTSVALEIAKVNANNKLGLKLLGGESLYNQKTLQDGGNAVEGLVIVVPWFREAPQSKKFASEAKQLWGGAVSWSTATSFDATQAFIKSLRFNPSRATILQELRKINLPANQTSGDVLKFNHEGERQNKPILVKVENNQFRCLPPDGAKKELECR